jgi:hypothetical protein
MNRGLNAMDGYRTLGSTKGKNAELERVMEEEFGRLLAKAAEMRHPTRILGKPADSDFYTRAVAAVNRHIGRGVEKAPAASPRPRHQFRR